MIPRRQTREIAVRGLKIGGEAPIAVQSMAATRTQDIPATLRQVRILEAAGADLVRWYMPTVRRASPKLRGAYDAVSATGTGIHAGVTEGAEGTGGVTLAHGDAAGQAEEQHQAASAPWSRRNCKSGSSGRPRMVK